MTRSKIRTSGAEGLTLSSTDVTIASGDLLFGTSAKGVNLGVTSNTDSNTLDDYEEGTFDPFTNVADQFSGEVIRTATYRKIGTMVAIDLRVNFTRTDNSSSNFTLAFNFLVLPY